MIIWSEVCQWCKNYFSVCGNETIQLQSKLKIFKFLSNTIIAFKVSFETSIFTFHLFPISCFYFLFLHWISPLTFSSVPISFSVSHQIYPSLNTVQLGKWHDHITSCLDLRLFFLVMNAAYVLAYWIISISQFCLYFSNYILNLATLTTLPVSKSPNFYLDYC